VALVGAVGSGGGGGGVVGVACFGVVGVVGDNAGSHRAREVWEVGVPLVSLPAYSPELNSVERVFCEVRRYVEGVVYGSLEAKMAAVEGALRGLCDCMVRLVRWDRIREAFGELAVRLTNYGAVIGIMQKNPASF
jgi:hypothetical protein